MSAFDSLPEDLKREVTRKLQASYFKVVLDELRTVTMPIVMHFECEYVACPSCGSAKKIIPVYLISMIEQSPVRVVNMARWGILHFGNELLYRYKNIYDMRRDIERGIERHVACRWLD